MTKGIQTGEPVAVELQVHQHFTIPGSTFIGDLGKTTKT